jgi:hypothetical protein
LNPAWSAPTVADDAVAADSAKQSLTLMLASLLFSFFG